MVASQHQRKAKTLISSILLLLVEDEPLISEMLSACLEDAGYQVMVADTGADALFFLDGEAGQPAGLITDIRLGVGTDGWAVARHARHKLPSLPVIYMTGDSAADWAAEGVPKSMLVQKPFAPSQIVTAIATLLNEAASSLAIGGAA
jgi:CheY-like chemotaxis protein